MDAEGLKEEIAHTVSDDRWKEDRLCAKGLKEGIGCVSMKTK